jgi:hypothetical protein
VCEFWLDWRDSNVGPPRWEWLEELATFPCPEALRPERTNAGLPVGAKQHPHRKPIVAQTRERSFAEDEHSERTICLTIKYSLKKLADLVEFASILALNHLGATVINLVRSSQIKIACSSDAISQST